jgi:hypothetical protein
MKILQNPIVTGALALGAVFIVFYQFGGAKLFKSKPQPAPQPTATATAPEQKASAKKTAAATAKKPAASPRKPTAAASAKAGQAPASEQEILLPDHPVDAAYVAARFSSWTKGPLRDPFLLMVPVVEELPLLTNETNSPVRTWTLKAIWNQTDRRLAVINDRVYVVGDEIVQGYRLVRIENDEVWFQGPTRNERLGFPERKGLTPTTGKTQPNKQSNAEHFSGKREVVLSSEPKPNRTTQNES